MRALTFLWFWVSFSAFSCQLVHPDLPKKSTSYQSFLKSSYQLYSWKGEYISFHTQNRYLSPSIMTSLVNKSDSAYEFLNMFLESSPKHPNNSRSNLLTIAEVDSSCSIACGYVGHKGIELENVMFQEVYDDMVNRREYNTVLLYELGRNFWFFDTQLYPRNTNSTFEAIRRGYATFLRQLLEKELALSPSEYNGEDFHQFFASNDSLFSSRLTYSHGNLLSFLNSSFSDHQEFYSREKASEPTLFWSAFFSHIYTQHGLSFLKDFFKKIKEQPKAREQKGVWQNLRNAYKDTLDSSQNKATDT